MTNEEKIKELEAENSLLRAEIERLRIERDQLRSVIAQNPERYG